MSGRTLAGDDPIGTTADLVFQNSDVFFVDDAREMRAISQDDAAFEATHLRSTEILSEMAQREASLFSTAFHSERHQTLTNPCDRGAVHTWVASSATHRRKDWAVNGMAPA